MVADCTVMGDMDIRHYESIVADLGHAFAAGLGTTVDGSALTDSDTVADFDIGDFTVEFQVLRNSSDYSTREDFAVLAECYIFIDYSIRMNLAAVTDGNVIINESKRADFYVVAEFCLRADECKRMDVIHFVLYFTSESSFLTAFAAFVLIVCPGLKAEISALRKPPESLRSPIRSSSLCLPHSLGK